MTSLGVSVMKRIIPVVLIGIFAIYLYEQRTGRDLFVGSTINSAAHIIDRTTGTSFASGATGGFAGGYGMATGVGASVGGGMGGLAAGVSGAMGQ